MSRIATDWAWSVKLRPSLKLILLSMADRADEVHQCFPSIKRLSTDTCLDKKTVQSGLNELSRLGVISDTGKRKGPTRRVKVYQIVPLMEYTQKRDSSENGCLNDPENGTLNDPENGLLNQSLNQSLNQPVKTSNSQANIDRYNWELVVQKWNEFAAKNELPSMRLIGDKRERTVKQSHQLANKLRKKSGKEPIDFYEYIDKYLQLAQEAITPFHKGQEKGSNWKADFNYIFAKDVTESLLTQGELKR